MAQLQRTTTSATAAIAQAGLLNSLLTKLRPLILKKGLEVGAEYGLKGWHFGDVGEAGIPIDVSSRARACRSDSWIASERLLVFAEHRAGRREDRAAGA